MKVRKVLLTLAVAAAALAAALPSEAARFKANFFGQIDFALDPGNGFGLNVDDGISGFAIYDTDALSTVTISAGGVGLPAVGTWQSLLVGQVTTFAPFALELTIGTQRFTAANDAASAAGFPELLFLDGAFVAFDFIGFLGPQDDPTFTFQSQATDFALAIEQWYAGGDPTQPFPTLQVNGRDTLGSPIEGYFTSPFALVVPVDDNNNVIPEPGTMLLLGSGLLGLAGYGRKRKG